MNKEKSPEKKPKKKKNSAIFVDLENMAYGSNQGSFFQIKYIMERIYNDTNPIIRKVYADWSRLSKYTQSFVEHAFELIQIVSQSYVKNSLDIHLAVDAIETMSLYNNFEVIYLITGDSDFCPLAKTLRKNGIKVVGVSWEKSSSWVFQAHCDEFIFYDDIQPHDNKNKPFSSFNSQNIALKKFDFPHQKIDAQILKDAPNTGQQASLKEKTFIYSQNSAAYAENLKMFINILRRKKMQILTPPLHQQLLAMFHKLSVSHPEGLPKEQYVELIMKGQYNKWVEQKNITRSKVQSVFQIALNAGCFDKHLHPKENKYIFVLQSDFIHYENFQKQHDLYLISFAQSHNLSLSSTQWSELLYNDKKVLEYIELILQDI